MMSMHHLVKEPGTKLLGINVVTIVTSSCLNDLYVRVSEATGQLLYRV